MVLMLVAVSVILLIAIVSCVLMTQQEGAGNIKFESQDVNYNEGMFGELKSVAVSGSIKNVGKDNIKFSKISFSCDAAFLQSKFDEPLKNVARNTSATVLAPGEVVNFYADLGGVASKTSSTSGNFVVNEDGLKDDEFTISVSKYYK